MNRPATAAVQMTPRGPPSRPPAVLVVAGVAATAWAGVGVAAEQTQPDHAPPLFVDVWFGGPLDSIYKAEYQRLSTVCSGQGDPCYREHLDTTAVPLTPVWSTAYADTPVGRIVTRLRTEGRWPHAALVFQGPDGVETTVRENLGDWGYGTTLAVRDVREGRLQPWLLSPVGEYWIGESGESTSPSFSIVDGPYGLDGRLWQLGPLTSPVELPAAVYMVLAVEGSVVRLRPEIPQDMACEPADQPAELPSPSVPVHEVPLAQLLDAAGRPTVEVAYPKGC